LLGVDQTWRIAVQPIAGGAALLRYGAGETRRADADAGLRAPLFDDASELRERFDFAFATQATPSLAIAFSQGFAAREIDQLLGGEAHASLSRDGLVDPYLDRAARAVGATTRLALSDSVAIRLTAVRSQADDPLDAFSIAQRTGETSTALKAATAMRVGGAALGFEAGVRRERGGPFGSRFGGVLGTPGASVTYYQSVTGDAPVAAGWRVRARASFGLTTVEGAPVGFIDGASGLRSSQFAVEAARSGVLARADRVSFGVVQPLRIESGTLLLTVPDRYDIEARALAFSERAIALDAGVREIDLEARYAAPVAGAAFEIAAIRQFNALGEGRDATAAIASLKGRF
jgi:hypothetical protein